MHGWEQCDQCKTEFSVFFYWEDFFEKKHISTLSSSLVAREPPIMTLDRLTGQLERDTKSPRGKFFLSICISVILLHHCIERREFKGFFTGLNFQIVTSKGLRKNYCLDILRQKKVEGTVTWKFSLIFHSSAKRLALMLKGCWLLVWKVNYQWDQIKLKTCKNILTSDLGLPLTNCALCLEQKFSRAPLLEPATRFHWTVGRDSVITR